MGGDAVNRLPYQPISSRASLPPCTCSFYWSDMKGYSGRAVPGCDIYNALSRPLILPFPENRAHAVCLCFLAHRCSPFSPTNKSVRNTQLWHSKTLAKPLLSLRWPFTASVSPSPAAMSSLLKKCVLI
ncbi:hypothetical protein AMELA_G00065920 [Ameiurus melas]|uniref:Uncharacterized protein n=1 Tax=Ameiurus melas TaxID=219545 RepID=A0A7J6B5N5_AMEME|nr:hypothetical protein AMELA_G00065920 [Ameiurus melas]